MNNTMRWLRRCHAGEPVLVCIHGWGANADVWLPWVDHVSIGVVAVQLPGFDDTPADKAQPVQTYLDFIAQLAQRLVNSRLDQYRITLVGWSLGGQIATSLAEPLRSAGARIDGLITLASNPCFVAHAGWPYGMDPAVYASFCQDFAEQPVAMHKRFNALQAQGAGNLRTLRQQQRAVLPAAPLPGSPAHAQWCNALTWLQHDTRAQLEHLQAPQLHFVAKNDALVPANTQLERWGEVITVAHSHCLPLEAPQTLARAIEVFIKTHRQHALSKHKVAEAFSVAAPRYDAFARVQKTVAKEVLRQLPDAHNKIVLDMGCGTGALTQGLLAVTQPATLYCADIALGMLQFARKQSSNDALQFVAADAEALPLASHSLDGIMSSLAIQWCEQPDVLMQEFFRVMKPGAWAVIATLGPNTLHELKAAWQAVDDCVHVNAFASRAVLMHACLEAGFAVDLEHKTHVCDYPSLMPLLKELKAIGAHNTHINAPAGLMTKTRLQLLAQHYPVTSQQSAPIEASYDVFYLTLHKPAHLG